jgi:transposase
MENVNNILIRRQPESSFPRYRKISDFLARDADLHVAPATFVRAEQRLADLARATYDLLLEALRHSHVVHADETGWCIGRLNAWLLVFSSPNVTIYAIRSCQGHNVPEDLLGFDFDGYLLVNGLKSYTALEVVTGRCNGHLLRRCKDILEVVPDREQPYLETLSTLLQEAVDLAHRREQFTSTGYTRREQEIEHRLDDWLDALPRSRSLELERLDNHIRTRRGECLVFLHDPEVPPINNHAEQMLRPAVITPRRADARPGWAGRGERA